MLGDFTKPLIVKDQSYRRTSGGERYEVLGIDDRWYDPESRYFRVAVDDGKVYLLRCDAEDQKWSIIQGAGDPH